MLMPAAAPRMRVVRLVTVIARAMSDARGYLGEGPHEVEHRRIGRSVSQSDDEVGAGRGSAAWNSCCGPTTSVM